MSWESFFGCDGTLLRIQSSQNGEPLSSNTRYPFESSVCRTASGTPVSVSGPVFSTLPSWAEQAIEAATTRRIRNRVRILHTLSFTSPAVRRRLLDFRCRKSCGKRKCSIERRHPQRRCVCRAGPTRRPNQVRCMSLSKPPPAWNALTPSKADSKSLHFRRDGLGHR